MPFIGGLAGLHSLSIVGMAKNVGKTETLNYVLGRLEAEGYDSVGLTSIGIDGEQTDQVTQTAKPEIVIPAGYHFLTSEKHYHARELVSRVVEVSMQGGALGRFIYAQACLAGKAILSGPASTPRLRVVLSRMQRLGVRLVIIDGALSRLSLASPAVTEGMILATGAALSSNPAELVRKTRFLHQLIALPVLEQDALRDRLSAIESGVWAIDADDEVHDLGIASVFLLDRARVSFREYGERLFVPGAITDRLLNTVGEGVTLIVNDFTRLFITPNAYRVFTQRGGSLLCLDTTRLLAVTFNPFSPSGYHLDSVRMCEELSAALGIPVYDVRRLRATG